MNLPEPRVTIQKRTVLAARQSPQKSRREENAMDQQGTHGDPIERIVKSHENISEYVEDLEQVLAILYSSEAWDKIKPIDDFLNRSTVEHFSFEEHSIFPIIRSRLKSPRNDALLEELEREHNAILEDVKEFRKIAADNEYPLDPKQSSKLYAAGKRAIDELLKHASKEDDKLVPILKKNSKLFG